MLDRSKPGKNNNLHRLARALLQQVFPRASSVCGCNDATIFLSRNVVLARLAARSGESSVCVVYLSRKSGIIIISTAVETLYSAGDQTLKQYTRKREEELVERTVSLTVWDEI